MTRTVRCPMRECRRSVDLDALPLQPARPEPAPCPHTIAAWGRARGEMVEEIVVGLAGNRELVIRNIRPAELTAATIEAQRSAIEAIARQFAREVLVDPTDASAGGALFGDPHERDAVSRE